MWDEPSTYKKNNNGGNCDKLQKHTANEKDSTCTYMKGFFLLHVEGFLYRG